ncbi:MAG TPA: septum formation family protein [Nocardioidaceae bacterium]|nr:septum formation family protein [Nocardioidaceae bacterium]
MLPRLAAPVAALLFLVLSACTQTPVATEPDVDTVEAPKLGACRVLTPADISEPSNASEVVDCAEEHTAETFAVGTFPAAVATGAVDDPALGAHIFSSCSAKFLAFLGGEESTVMRSTLTWAWFRPSEKAWEQGARWYRCDVVGGAEQSEQLIPLPETAKGLLLGRPEDRWMVCVNGPTVAGSVKIPCSEPHTWRAVTTIKLGDARDPYPGDRLVEVRTRDFCSDSVGAWLNYPVDYDFGYTYFHEAEWEAGNRRSICWAKTDQ